jgi:hypothetical protein
MTSLRRSFDPTARNLVRFAFFRKCPSFAAGTTTADVVRCPRVRESEARHQCRARRPDAVNKRPAHVSRSKRPYAGSGSAAS